MKKILVAAFISITFFLLNANQIKAVGCGNFYSGAYPYANCSCESITPVYNTGGNTTYCCGWIQGATCLDKNPNPTPTVGPISAGSEVDKTTLNSLNPIKIFSTKQTSLKDPGSIISRALDFAFPIAGLILFIMLVWGGFEMLVSSTNKANVDAGKQRITAAIIGFIILFSAFWIAQILEKVFGITILG